MFSALITVLRVSSAGGSSVSTRTHAETVQLGVAFGNAPTVMNSPSSRWSARPNRPSSTHVPPVSSPSRRLPDRSFTTVPSPSSNGQ
ncbi:hypothetical protein BE08_45200 [Sorangium cellulosum]|uniref:Uncharacterized protein n=1 Tax=Sorangium cellulosum TaxID=56 RepID=A0A150P4P2_SORCE|nr:hypothetical protein BE08_45200 [Sorangium cellulosum]